MRKPSIFIGSSNEGKDIAYKLGVQLEDVGEVRVWTEGIFDLSHRFFESLANARLQFDFAILVLSPDDSLARRGQNGLCPRDNVIFEAGYFMGHLGKDRTFLVYDRSQSLLLPSDLEGVSMAGFEGNRADQNVTAALRGTSDGIRTRIRELGSLAVSAPVEVTLGSERYIVSHGADGLAKPLHVRRVQDGISFPLGATEVTIRHGRIENTQAASSAAVMLPANEFFDDECIRDPRSALGAFVQSQFTDQVTELQTIIRSGLNLSASKPVEKRLGIIQDSYGVGTCVFVDRPLGSAHRMILAAVTTDRFGIRSEASFIMSALRQAVAITSANRISRLHMPLMGSGHGSLRPEASLLATLVGLAEVLPTSARNLKEIEIVVFKDVGSGRPPAISLPAITHVVASVVGVIL